MATAIRGGSATPLGTFNCETQLAEVGTQRATLSGQIAIARQDLTAAINRTTGAENEVERQRNLYAAAVNRSAAMTESNTSLLAILGPLYNTQTGLTNTAQNLTADITRQRARNEATALRLLNTQQETATVKADILALQAQLAAS